MHMGPTWVLLSSTDEHKAKILGTEIDQLYFFFGEYRPTLLCWLEFGTLMQYMADKQRQNIMLRLNNIEIHNLNMDQTTLNISKQHSVASPLSQNFS